MCRTLCRIVVIPLLVAVALCGALPAATADAHTIDPYTFEELVEMSGFTGLVECTTAGGIVARYRVLETWKGELEPGDTFTLRVATSYWGPQFPLALVGQRWVVTGMVNPQTRLMSYTSGGGVPLFWRRIPSDYRLPLFQGRVRITDEGEDAPERGYGLGTSTFESLDELRTAATRYATADAAGREALMLAGLARKVFGLGHEREGESDRHKALRTAMAGTPTTEQTLAAVGTYLRDGRVDEYQRNSWVRVLTARGGRTVVDLLQADGNAERFTLADKANDIVEAIRKRLAEQAARDNEDENGESDEESDGDDGESDGPPPPTDEELATWTKALKAGGEELEEHFGDILNRMPPHAPGPLIDYLCQWENRVDDWRDANRGYVIGCWVCWRCAEDGRADHLRKLTQAKNPYLRVAAAIWLTFDDHEAGMKALRACLELDGDPGAWAALNLLRRGDKSAMPRALQVFAVPDGAGMDTVPHDNLQRRLLVLLSNSASAADIELPTPEYEEGADAEARAKTFHATYVEWWKQHADDIGIRDPWFKQLAAQRID